MARGSAWLAEELAAIARVKPSVTTGRSPREILMPDEIARRRTLAKIASIETKLREARLKTWVLQHPGWVRAQGQWAFLDDGSVMVVVKPPMVNLI